MKSKFDRRRVAQTVLWLRLSQMVINEAYKSGMFKVPIHLAFGHEAMAAALAYALRPEDKVLLTHRNIAYNLARAYRPRYVSAILRSFLHEYMLRPTGLARGRCGSMNLTHPSVGIMYTSSILGNQFSVACGVALGKQVRGEKGVVVVMGGDGSIEEGAFYESLLFAKSVKLPILFLIENNEWSMHTHITERRTPIALGPLCASLAIPFVSLAGNNVFLYCEKLVAMRKKVQQLGMPLCVEVAVKTLGDWYDYKNPQHPKGKWVKYHVGASPSVSLSAWPLLQQHADDPVFVLSKLLPLSTIQKEAAALFNRLQRVTP